MIELTVSLSGKRIGIQLSDGAEKGAALCRAVLGRFLSPGVLPRSMLSIRRCRAPETAIPGWPKSKKALLEKRLPDKEVLAWLRQEDFFQGGFPLSEQSICSYCLGALHVFDPLTAAGYAFLPGRGRGRFSPLFRLLWMYFAQVLGQAGGCFLHGAAVGRKGSGYLFLGDSGAGKSTVAGLLTEGVILSDEGPILRANGKGHRLFPSPFHQLGDGFPLEFLPASVPLRGLFFLAKGEETYVEEISGKEAFSLIISRHIHFFPYLSGEARLLLFDLLFEITHTVPVRYLHFSIHGDIWSVLKDASGGGMK